VTPGAPCAAPGDLVETARPTPELPMRRRHLFAAAALTLARPALGQGTATAARVLKFVPQSDLAVLDPIVTTSNATRHHGFVVWDTLYGFNQDYAAEPQMAEGHEVANDGRRITIKLREGLKFHDGTPVRGADCVASIRRWAARDPLGQVLLARIEEMAAPDDRSILIRLSRPFPQLFAALAKPSAPVCFIMPERLATTCLLYTSDAADDM
jgi:peptide/nickel transport system substrate-binding protein